MKKRMKAEDCPYIEEYRWDMKIMDYVLVSRKPNPKYKGEVVQDIDLLEDIRQSNEK